MALDFYIEIENSAGQRQGSGPITSAANWRYTARMDQAGDFSFTMPATDPKAILVQKKRIVRAYAMLGSQRVEVGAGVIDHIERKPQDDGTVLLRVSGNDLIRELNYRSVLNLKLYIGGNPVSHAASVAAVGAYAPPGWTFTPDPAPPSDSVYGYFNGESVLAGLIKTAEKSQSHFYRGPGRTLIFGSTFTPSGIRAIRAKGDLGPTTCAITRLTETVELYDLITRIYPRGSGNAEAQLTLRATTRTAPPGYTLNKSENYIEHNASTAAYGRIERQVDFRDTGPVENTTPDVVSAANMLFDSALEYLKRHSVELDQAAYTLELAVCSALLRPLQTIRVVFRDPDAGLNINADLNILQATWAVDGDQIGTTSLVVSNADRWPDSDQRVLVGTIAEGRVYQALPQLNANSYALSYSKNVDYQNIASFRFRFGAEVVQLQSVMFEFQVLQFESTVKSVGTSTGGSGTVTTGAPNINASGNPDNNSSGTPSNNTSGAASGNTGAASGNTGSPSSNTSGAPSSNTSGAPSNNTSGAASGNTGTASGNTGAAAGNTGAASGNTGGSGALTTDEAQGGDTDPSGFHQHAVNVIAGAGSLGNVTLHQTGGLYFLANSFVTGSEPVYVTPGGDHVHGLASHTHDLASHTHGLNSHTHSLNSHTHDLGGHTHSLNSHTHSLNSHTHDLASHTHDLASHTHDLASHTHSLNSHTHSLSNHIHGLNNHTHSLEGGIEAVYGIFRASVVSTYQYDDLEYRVNGGSWLPASASVDAGNGWRRLDITALVMHPDTFRPLQENNILEVRGGAPTMAIPIQSWSASGEYILVTTTVNHNLQVGDVVDISGTLPGPFEGETINGLNYPVAVILAANRFAATRNGGNAEVSPPGAAGTVTVHNQATIDAQLSIRNVIQAIAYQ